MPVFFLNRKLGGFGSAGSHQSMARAEIPLEKLSKVIDTKDESHIVKWIKEQFDFIRHHDGNKK